MPFNRYICELEDLDKRKQNIYTVVIVILVALTTIKRCIYEEYNFILIFVLLIHTFTILYSLPLEKADIILYVVGLTIFTLSYLISYSQFGQVYMFFIGIEFTLGAIYNLTKNKFVLLSAFIVLFFSFLNYMDVGQYIDEKNWYVCMLIQMIYWAGTSILIVTKIAFIQFKKKMTAKYKKDWDDHKVHLEDVSEDRVSALDLDELVQLAYKNHTGFTVKFKDYFPVFTKKIETWNYSVVTAEFEVIALLKMNFSTKEIARVTGSTVRAIESKKYRIRKKLKIPSDVDMSMFLSKH